MDAVRLDIDADGIAWITFDDPDEKVNLLSSVSVSQLDLILEELARKKPTAIVFISGKPDVFIAGADIKELARIRDADHGTELSQAGHEILGKIEKLGVPSVAAIHGACLGGGCELALACEFRVVTDERKTQIGLPETQLGIIPGWGGTQRLPRLIGLRAALGIIVPGKSVDGVKALKIGLADAAVPLVALRDTAKQFALGRRKARRKFVVCGNKPPLRGFICRAARKEVLKRSHGFYPAPLRAIDAVEEGLSKGKLEEGLALEAKIFGEVSVSSQSKNLIRVFFLREKYAKLKAPGAESPKKKVEKVGVLGAGVMGAGIAHWCSARGLTVRLKDMKPEFVAAGMKRIEELYHEGVKRRKLSALDAEHGRQRIHPTTDYTGFARCDLVIEAVVESIQIKSQLFREVMTQVSLDCIVASNTSAIPIDELAEASGRAERFVGIHFFNPVHKMPLVEIVRGTKTTPETVALAVEFAKQLKKLPVVVKGSPGFLVNRVLMPYLNEAGKMLEEGVSVEDIDKAMLDFGMPMGPLRLIDEVGIDVAGDVATELAEAFKDRMTVAPILRRMLDEGHKGRKGGAGFYIYDGESETVNRKYRSFVTGEEKTLDAKTIQRRLLTVMIDEARRCMQEGVVSNEDDIDAGMIFGTGFPPFRGGLVKYARDNALWVTPQTELYSGISSPMAG
jgi:3-hydroxyacyl-CoA dehydrogenase / enoyl-CoA hydratase / 3-hydroxybutyryl-CoA epimerase